jgi:hypothetical protein
MKEHAPEHSFLPLPLPPGLQRTDREVSRMTIRRQVGIPTAALSSGLKQIPALVASPMLLCVKSEVCRMKPTRSVYTQICALVLVAVITELPVSAQTLVQTLLDPANVSSVFGGVQINNNNIRFEPPHFDQVPRYIQALPVHIAQAFLNPIGAALAVKIREARQNVRNQGCGPAPEFVLNELSPFMPRSVFNGVCWAVLTPGMGIDSLVIEDGGMAGITLDDTIVFKDQQSGFRPDLWAHEMTHVLQYRRLSVEGFANIYSYDFRRLEGEAYEFQNFVSARINTQPDEDAWRQQYYDPTNDWNSNAGMTAAKWSVQAKMAINPYTCSGFQLQPNGVQIFNNCPIAFRVAVLHFRALQTGEPVDLPCQIQMCIILPGQYGEYPDPPGLTGTGATMTWM